MSAANANCLIQSTSRNNTNSPRFIRIIIIIKVPGAISMQHCGSHMPAADTVNGEALPVDDGVARFVLIPSHVPRNMASSLYITSVKDINLGISASQSMTHRKQVSPIATVMSCWVTE